MKHYISIHFEQGSPFHSSSKKTQRYELWFDSIILAMSGMKQAVDYITDQGGVVISTQYSLILS